MKNLNFSAKISAPVKKVWETMLTLDTYKKWTNVAWPGSSYIGDWQQGENIRFVGANGGGTLANLTTVEPYKNIKAIHNAILLEGGTAAVKWQRAGWGLRKNIPFLKKMARQNFRFR